MTVTDVAARFGDLPAGGWSTPPAQAMVLPLTGETASQATASIVLAASAGRALDEAYGSFLGLVAQQTAALVNGAVAYQVQQRRAEELAELDRAKTTFFSNISHEFRTPLTLIMGPVEELRATGRRTRRAGPRRQELEVIHRNGLRLGKLVNTLLDFSRIEAGRMEARYEPVDLAAFTADLASVFRSAIDRAGLAYEVDCPELPAAGLHRPGDVGEGRPQPAQQRAEVHLRRHHQRVRCGPRRTDAVLRVSDTGSGIAAAEMPRLFERFHRIPDTRVPGPTRAAASGWRWCASWSGCTAARITAESTEGAGTTFTVRLPFGHGHLPEEHLAAAGPDTISAAADPFLAEALRWLPGDQPDEPPLAAARCRRPAVRRGPARTGRAGRPGPGAARRRQRGHARVPATAAAAPATRSPRWRTGRPRWTRSGRSRFDLVISDVMMPGLDGLQLVAALRADPRHRGPAGAAAVGPGRPGGRHRGPGRGRGRLPGQAVLRRRAAGAGPGERGTGPAAQPPRPVAGGADRLAARGVLPADEAGRVIEINATFTDILGYGPDGLPYATPHPWWPRPGRRSGGPPPGQRGIRPARWGRARAVSSLRSPTRTGTGCWVAASFNEVQDPDTGRRMVVGTLRDITAERYAGQREEALAAMGLLLSQADSLPEALQGALNELRRLWHARRVIAATWTGRRRRRSVPPPTPASGWARTCPASSGEPGSADCASGPCSPRPTGRQPDVGISIEHPEGELAVWIDADPARPFTAEDRALFALLCGYLGQALHRAHQTDQQRETALALQRAILGPARLPGVRGPLRAGQPPAGGGRRLV